MGQRSQIYIRWDIDHKWGKATSHPVVKKYKGLIARYYQWNYSERMISRARSIIEAIHDEYIQYPFLWEDGIEKLRRICDINFDMRDVLISSDILKEIEDQWEGDWDYLFNQDNNDGQLLIDVTSDSIKYCFIPFYTEASPMDGETYMRWDNGGDWHNPTKYMMQEVIDYTNKNCFAISEYAHLMTEDEAKEFVKRDYKMWLEEDPF